MIPQKELHALVNKQNNIYVIKQDRQCFMIEFIHNTWWLDMFRTSTVHPQEPLQAVRCKFGTPYRVILSVLDPRKCEYLKDYSLYFEHAYMTTYLAS